MSWREMILKINNGLVNLDTYSWNINDYEYSHASQGKQQCEQNLHAIRWKNHWLLVTRICLQFCFIGTVFFIVDVVVNWGDDDMFLSSNSQSWVHSSPRFFWNLMITCPKDIGGNLTHSDWIFHKVTKKKEQVNQCISRR